MNLVTDDIVRSAGKAREMYHRLVLLIALSGAGKTGLLRAVSEKHGVPYVNVNLDLSRRLLDMTTRQRAMQVGRVIREIVTDADHPVVLFDNTEVLFDQTLKQDPLRLLKDLSRSTAVVASWNGTLDGNGLTYAQPGHPEYQRYPPSEIDFICLTDNGSNP